MGVPIVGPAMRKLFGTRNERLVKRYLRVVEQVNAFEDKVRVLTDQEIHEQAGPLREQLAAGAKPVDILPEVFAVAARPTTR